MYAYLKEGRQLAQVGACVEEERHAWAFGLTYVQTKPGGHQSSPGGKEDGDRGRGACAREEREGTRTKRKGGRRELCKLMDAFARVHVRLLLWNASARASAFRGTGRPERVERERKPGAKVLVRQREAVPDARDPLRFPIVC